MHIQREKNKLILTNKRSFIIEFDKKPNKFTLIIRLKKKNFVFKFKIVPNITINDCISKSKTKILKTHFILQSFPKTSWEFEKLSSTVRKHTICDRFPYWNSYLYQTRNETF